MLHNYSIEQTPTETSASGVLLYMNQILLYKPRTDLEIYLVSLIQFTLKSSAQNHLM